MCEGQECIVDVWIVWFGAEVEDAVTDFPNFTDEPTDEISVLLEVRLKSRPVLSHELRVVTEATVGDALGRSDVLVAVELL
jgi:hypothetical protein